MNAPHDKVANSSPPAAAHTAARRKKRNARRGYSALTSVVILGLTSYFLINWLTQNQESTDDAQIGADIVALSARVGGPLVQVAVQDNQTVHKGDLLAQIDRKDYEIMVRQAEAEYEAALAQAEEGSREARSSTVDLGQIAAARAALSRASAEKSKAEADLERARKLRGQQAVSIVELENAQNAFDKADAATRQASAQLEVAQEQHSMAHAKVAAAAAALENMRSRLSYTSIVAPNDGMLSKIAVKEGELVEPGRLIAQMVTGQPFVVANFKEVQVGRMKPGQRAEIEIDAYPGASIEGRVISISPATGAQFSLLPPDNATGNFVKVVQRVPVKIELVHIPKEVTLRAGMSVDAKVYFN